MRWSDIDFHPARRTLRQFAGLWLAFFGGLAAWRGLVLHEPRAPLVLAAIALAIGLLGIALPWAIRPVYAAWMALAFPIGWVVSRVVLAGLFYLLFTPVALAFRLIGRDALVRRRRPERQTHWVEKRGASDPSRYLRQF